MNIVYCVCVCVAAECKLLFIKLMYCIDRLSPVKCVILHTVIYILMQICVKYDSSVYFRMTWNIDYTIIYMYVLVYYLGGLHS